jgi:hypothetical protein
MRTLIQALFLFALGWLFFSAMAPAAPALKDRPEPIAGTLFVENNSPVLYAGRCDEQDPVWLIFPDDETEARLMANIGAGDRVKVIGRSMTGGEYGYLIVTAITKDD